MAATAVLVVPASSGAITIGRTIIDWENQKFVFQYNNMSRTYDPTSGEYNYVRNGMNTLLGKIPNISSVSVEAYATGLHTNPGGFI